ARTAARRRLSASVGVGPRATTPPRRETFSVSALYEPSQDGRALRASAPGLLLWYYVRGLAGSRASWGDPSCFVSGSWPLSVVSPIDSIYASLCCTPHGCLFGELCTLI